ncbi:MAG: hypothetical protein U5N55_03520 [Cypionkella sp.]|nr:hypothetical protein [Cypionkella sp.]
MSSDHIIAAFEAAMKDRCPSESGAAVQEVAKSTGADLEYVRDVIRHYLTGLVG